MGQHDQGHRNDARVRADAETRPSEWDGIGQGQAAEEDPQDCSVTQHVECAIQLSASTLLLATNLLSCFVVLVPAAVCV